MTTKSDFEKNCNVENITFGSAYNRHIEYYIYAKKYIRVEPKNICPYTPITAYTLGRLFYQTSSPWTKQNLKKINAQIPAYIKLWKRQAAEWRKNNLPIIRIMKQKASILAAARQAGITGRSRGSDTNSITILEYITKKRTMERYHASGNFLAIIEDTRTRTYSKSSKWRPSVRSDVFLVGQNENGNPFVHQVPNTIRTIPDAWEWIWQGAKIINRHGDVGIAPSGLKKVSGDDMDVDVMGGHSRHRFFGEVYRNGSLHIRSGFLYHTANQHPPIYLDGSRWRRIVIGRRSTLGMSSMD